MQKRITVIVLCAILLAAAGLRLYALDRGDVISDEALYGIRSIGYLDFDFAVAQPTTLQLFNNIIPWWTKLSFHDHPPLVFLVQHLFMGMFGVNRWGLRLSSALFGIASVYFLYLIGKRLFSERAGLIAAALMAVNVLSVYASRVAIQEAQVIFLILLTVYCFLRAQERPRWYLAWGVCFGAALLSKYTAIFLVLPFVAYWLLYDRKIFRQRWWYVGLFAVFVIISPVIIYNILLFKTFGHFDFQLFYIFGQRVPYWTVTPGKEIGSVADRLRDIPVNLWRYNSWISNLSLIAGTAWLLYAFVKQRSRVLVFLTLLFFSNIIFYLAIGPAPRFLTMLMPWGAAAAGIFFAQLLSAPRRKIRAVALAAVVLLAGADALYAANTAIAYEPAGTEKLHYSPIHWDMHAWEYHALDRYLLRLLADKYPERLTAFRYEFINEIRREAVRTRIAQGKQPFNALFIYNDNLFHLATLWILNRRMLYEGWSMMPVESYKGILAAEGDDFFRKQGFTDFFFIQNTDKVLLNIPERMTPDGDHFEEKMLQKGILPVELKNHQGEVVFKIYKF